MAGLRWLHRLGYLTTFIVVAALAYGGYIQYLGGKEPRRAEASSGERVRKTEAVHPDYPSPRYLQGLWTLTTKSSQQPEPRTVRVCMNDDAPGEFRTCAGVGRPPTSWAASTVVSCTSGWGQRTTSASLSNDSRVMRYRSDYASLPLPDGAAEKGWADTTMTYEGQCPAPMKDGQSFLLVRPDGKVVDPFPTACMVAVLKTVPFVTKPMAGYVWDALGGPRPFVRYMYPSRHDRQATDITFTADSDLTSDPAKVNFVASMSGLFSPNDKGPDTFGAEKFLGLWKDRCGVTAGIEDP